MKDKRNCNTAAYPIYPQPIMPIMGVPGPYNMGYQSNNSIEQQINNLEQQLNNLEARVNRLESLNNTNNNKYNNSNYYMV